MKVLTNSNGVLTDNGSPLYLADVADENAVHYTSDTGKSAAEKAQARDNIGVTTLLEAKQDLGKLTIDGTEYILAISTTDEGTAGYITFVVEA